MRGWEFSAEYVAEGIWNVDGGIRTGSNYQGMVQLGAFLDWERFVGWKGASSHVGFYSLHGKSPSGRLVGDLQAITSTDAPENSYLYQIWHQQAFGDFSVRLGSILADEEFAVLDSAGGLWNASFGWPTGLAGNLPFGGPAYPFPVLGIRFAWEPEEGPVHLRLGFYDGDPVDGSFDSDGDPDYPGDYKLDDDQGMFSIFEASAPVKWKGKDGVYRLGAWHHSADHEDLHRDRFGNSFVLTNEAAHVHDENYGFYTSGEQRIWNEAGDEGQGLDVFGRVTWSPENRNFFPYTFSGGMTYRGLIPGRDNDLVSLGTTYAEVSRDFRRQEKDIRRMSGDGLVSNFEWVTELNYEIDVTHGFAVQTMLGWVQHPGGSRALDDATVLGVRAILSF